MVYKTIVYLINSVVSIFYGETHGISYSEYAAFLFYYDFLDKGVLLVDINKMGTYFIVDYLIYKCYN
ncbi:MAG TPA: hypothetical protein DGK91_10220 [Clostridium sp.]|jgi:hypothetical protein|nr:hypothetical protein [Clostridium sp.]